MVDNRKMKADPSIVYQYHPNGIERCELCAMYRPNSECSAVHGYIARNGWCRIFESLNALRLRK